MTKVVQIGALVLALVASGPGCTPQPSMVREVGLDAGPPTDLGGDSGALVLGQSRPFGKEQETPAHLVAAGDKLFVLTDGALYLLDGQARVLRRAEWPTAPDAGGARPLVHAARWDGSGLGLTVRWPGSAALATGTYLALTDGLGAFSAKAMIRVSSSTAAARAWFDGTQHRVLWSRQQSDGKLSLQLTTVSRASAAVSGSQQLVSGLPPGTGVGAVAHQGSAVTLCTTDGASISLRRFAAGKARAPLVLAGPSPASSGPCGVAHSGHSTLATFLHRALAPASVDWGVVDPDLGPGTVSYPVPMAQLVDPQDGLLPAALRLSTAPGTTAVEDLLWDGGRYLVLVNTAGYRGGRLLLVVLDETGKLLGRPTIPLQYEPGRLVAARLVASSTDLVLLYSIRRPWDNGVLYLARLTVNLGSVGK